MSIPHDDHMPWVGYVSPTRDVHPLCRHSTFREHVVLGHAQRSLAVHFRRKSMAREIQKEHIGKYCIHLEDTKMRSLLSYDHAVFHECNDVSCNHSVERKTTSICFKKIFSFAFIKQCIRLSIYLYFTKSSLDIILAITLQQVSLPLNKVPV